MLYGCEAWTLTKDLTTTLKRTQRKMLRLVLNTPRRRETTQQDNDDTNSNSTNDVNSNPSNTTNLENLIQLTDDDLLEPWADFMKRATHTAEALAHKHNVEDWPTLHLRRQWRWAQRVAQQSHDRWSWLAAGWDPTVHDKRTCNRQQARPRKRWSDDITQFLQPWYHTATETHDNNHNLDWRDLATDTQLWKSLEDNFITYTQQSNSTQHLTTNNDTTHDNDIDHNNNTSDNNNHDSSNNWR